MSATGPATLYVTRAASAVQTHRYAYPLPATPSTTATWRWSSADSSFPDLVAVVPVFAHAAAGDPMRACEHHSAQQVFADTCASIHDEAGGTAAIRPIVCVHPTPDGGDACYAELCVSAFEPDAPTFYFAQSLWAASTAGNLSQNKWEKFAATQRHIPPKNPVDLTRAHVQAVVDRTLWLECSGKDSMTAWSWYNEPTGLGQSHPYPYTTAEPSLDVFTNDLSPSDVSVGVSTPPQLFTASDLKNTNPDAGSAKNPYRVALNQWYMYPGCSVHPFDDGTGADQNSVTWSWSQEGGYSVNGSLGDCVKLKSDWRGKTVVFRDPERLDDQYVIFNGQDIPYFETASSSSDRWRVFLTMRILCETAMLGQQFTHVVTDTDGSVYACTKEYFQSNVATALGVRVSPKLTEGICPFFMCRCEAPSFTPIAGVQQVGRLFKGLQVSLEAFSKTMADGTDPGSRPSDRWMLQYESEPNNIQNVTAGDSNNVKVGAQPVTLQFGTANGSDDSPYITIGDGEAFAANPASVLPLWHNLPGSIVATEQEVTAPRRVAIQPGALRPIIGFDRSSTDLAFYSEPGIPAGTWGAVSQPPANPPTAQYCGFGSHGRMTQMMQFHSGLAFYAEAKNVFTQMQIYKSSDAQAMLVAVGLDPKPVIPFGMPSGPLPPRGNGGGPSGGLLALGVCGAGLLLGFVAAQRGRDPAHAAHRL